MRNVSPLLLILVLVFKRLSLLMLVLRCISCNMPSCLGFVQERNTGGDTYPYSNLDRRTPLTPSWEPTLLPCTLLPCTTARALTHTNRTVRGSRYVKSPMDFRIVMRNLQHGVYIDVEEVIEGVTLVVDNGLKCKDQVLCMRCSSLMLLSRCGLNCQKSLREA